tara:strand:- start:2504 stop:2770 length:267 start_codon:yes stop_codon:yes gene_type:complete
MKSSFSGNCAQELYRLLTTGSEYEKNNVMITTRIVNSSLTFHEAIDERLDIIFDDVFSSNTNLSNDRELLERTLRRVGLQWKNGLGRA